MKKHIHYITGTLLLCLLLSLSFQLLAQKRIARASSRYPGNNRRINFSGYVAYEIRNGELWVWGYNNYGQLGDGSTNLSRVPIRIGTDNDWASAAGGLSYSLAVKTNGTLWSCGRNNFGQLGDGSYTNRSTFVQVGNATDWVSVDGGQGHTVGLKSNGTLWGLGYNISGQLGDGTYNDRIAPAQIGTDSNWTSFAVSYNSTHAIKSDGSLWVWGYNGYGQLGLGNYNDQPNLTRVGSANDWVAVAAKGFHVLALKSNGTLWSWGRNDYGQLGHGNTTQTNTPAQVGTDTTWVAVSANYYHSLALKSNGTLWSWGRNDFGQIGNGTNTQANSPAQVGTDTKWTAIATGIYNSVALRSDGTIWICGVNSEGELGTGSVAGQSTVLVNARTAPGSWISEVNGSQHSAALRADGTVWSWGGNSQGQLGDSSLNNRANPAQMGNDKNWMSIAGGELHMLGIKGDGTLWAWGRNNYGQLGDNSNATRTTPVQVGTDRWINTGAGSSHTLAVKADGTLWAWGRNNNGQVGDNSMVNRTAPVQIGTDNKWLCAGGGEYFTIALKTNGTLWAWGDNLNGYLGDSTYFTRLTPTQVGTDNKWVSISVGFTHTLALKADGSLWGWGSNNFGQLGDGTTAASKFTPARIGSSRDWVAISAGQQYSLAIKSDGTLWAWGRNDVGQLGDGSGTSKTVPTQVTGHASVIVLGQGCYSSQSAIIKADRSSLCMAGNDNYGQLGDGLTSGYSTSYNCGSPVCTGYRPATASTTYTSRQLAATGNRTDFQLGCILGPSVAPSGANPITSTATAKVFLDASVKSFRGTPYVQRHYDIEPTVNANTATATITLYYTQADFTAFNAARGNMLPLPASSGDVAQVANLRITQYHGVPTGGNDPVNYPATRSGSGSAHELIIPTSVTWDTTNNWWAVTFPVTGFSGFFASTNVEAPLPVRLLSFSAQQAGRNRNRINWATGTEDPGTTFEVTRSNNGILFETVGKVPGEGDNATYAFYDEHPLSPVNYYRLKVTSPSGEVSYSNTVIIGNGTEGGTLTVSPVPASNTITITNGETLLNGTMATIYNMQGAEMSRFVIAGTNIISVENWAAGNYLLKTADGKVFRLIKK